MVFRKVNSIWASFSLLVFSVLAFVLLAEITLAIIDPLNRLGKPSGFREKKTGQNPFRIPLPKGAKPDSEFRILAFGDSFTWGDGIDDPQKIWPAWLERRVKKAFPERGIRVINMGICGLTTINELELLVKVGQGLEPDWLISIEADAVEGVEMQGLYTAFVDLSISVKDLALDKEIYTNSLNRQKGIDLDFEKAANKALVNAAETLQRELLEEILGAIR